MVRKLLLAAIIWMVSASLAWAEDWYKYDEIENYGDIYVDNDSFRRVEKYLYHWELRNLFEPEKGVLSIKAYTKLDCESLSFRILKIEIYDSHFGKGKLLDSFNPEEQGERYRPPRSTDLGMYRVWCMLFTKLMHHRFSKYS